jgi:hypothetical protein
VTTRDGRLVVQKVSTAAGVSERKAIRFTSFSLFHDALPERSRAAGGTPDSNPGTRGAT